MTRPVDIWRICGEDVAYGPGCGCTCGPGDPTRLRAERAAERLGVQLPERPPRRRLAKREGEAGA